MTISNNGFKTPLVRALAFASTGSTAFVCSGLYFDWNKSEWAAWVQAVGAIAAIAVAFSVANRQQKAAIQDKKSVDIRRIQAICALYQNVMDMATELKNVLEPDSGYEVGPHPWRHLEERRQAILQLSIFDVPDERLAIAMIPMPLSLETLCDALRALWRQVDEPPPYEFPAGDRVDAALNVVINRARETIDVCGAYLRRNTQ